MISRRQFVRTAGLGALAGAGVRVTGAQADSNLQPDIKSGSSKFPRLLPGCCAYSYDKDLRHGPMSMEDFILKAVELRVVGVDMTAYYFSSTDPEYLHSLRHLAYRHALAFSGAACGVSMVQPDAAKRADSLSEIKKWVDVTEQLGASHLRIFAGKLPEGAAFNDAITWVVEAMKAACDYSGRKGITLGVEDHEGVTQNASVCIEIMQRVNSPYAGINLDITNFVTTPAQDAYSQIAACIPYATNIHVRDRFYDGTPVDMDRVWQIFAQAGHQGYVSAEYESSSANSLPPSTGVPRLVEKIQALSRRYSSV